MLCLLAALPGSETSRFVVLQDLEFNWRLVVATIVGFLGSAFGTVGGVGGGGIFVPLLNLVLGFDTKSAAALSKCKLALLDRVNPIRLIWIDFSYASILSVWSTQA